MLPSRNSHAFGSKEAQYTGSRSGALPASAVVIGLVLIGLAAGCGGGSNANGGGGGGIQPAPEITLVSVACSPSAIQTGQTSTCTPTVSGTGNFDSAVTWSVSPSNSGDVSSSGVFTPATDGAATITATSVQDTTKSGAATVTVSSTAVPTTPVIIPSILLAGEETSVTMTCFVRGASSSTGVEVFSLASGAPVLIGTMNDNGQDGDKVAGDEVYTIVANLRTPPSSSLPLQVVATAGANVTNASITVQLVQIPFYGSNSDVNQAESEIYNTAIQTRTSFSNPDWGKPTLLSQTSGNMVSIFEQFVGVVNQNTKLVSTSLAIKKSRTDTSAVNPHPQGIAQSILDFFTHGLFSPAQNASSCSQLIQSLGGFRDSATVPVLSIDDPQLQQFAQELATICATDQSCQGAFDVKDFLTDNVAAASWAHEYIVTGGRLPTPIAGCGGAVASSVANVAVKSDVEQFTDLVGEGVSSLVDGGKIAQKLVNQAIDTLVGWVVDGSGKSTVVIGQAGPTETFAAPTGTYTLAASFGGDTANGTITNTPVYPSSITNISPSPGTSITVSPPYITAFNPMSGPPGTSVAIIGTGFDPSASSNNVTFGGVSAQVTSSTVTAIQTSVPTGATSGPISLTTASGSTTTSLSFTVTSVAVSHVLTVVSTNPNSGVVISATPTDSNGQSNGTTQFTLTYNSGIAVTLTAPSTAAGNNFSNWTGCDNASTTTCSVMMNGNRTVIANYSAPGTSALVVASTNPGTGVPVTVSPADNSGNADGNTLLTRTYTNGTTVTLNVPSASGGTNFSGWTGCDSSSGTSCTVMMATENRLVTANYGSALTPACVYVANLGLAATGNNVSAYRIDPTTGALTSVGSFQVGDLSGPRALATDPAGRFLYVAASLGFIAGYTIQPDCSLGQQFTTAAPLASGPESIAIDPSGKFLYVIYSLSGGGAVYAIDPNSGALQQTSTFETGQVPIWITIDPPGHFAYVANLFSNNASGYEINPTTGALLPIVGPPPSPFPAETFPLSVASDPTGRFAYIANYLATNGASISSDISAYRVDSTTGGLNAIGGSPFGTGRFLFYLGDLPAASTTPIVVHPNGVWLYAAAADTASNAGAVFLFALDPLTGTLTPKQIGPFAAGQDPVAIALDPTGQFLYVANFTSSNILTYVVDPSSGALTAVPNSATQTGAGPSAVIVTGKKPLP